MLVIKVEERAKLEHKRVSELSTAAIRFDPDPGKLHWLPAL